MDEKKCPEKPEKMDEKKCADEFEELMEDMMNLVYNEEGLLGRFALSDKPVPTDPTGDECTCASIKNYPRDTRRPREKSREAPERLDPQPAPVSDKFFGGLK